MFQPHHLKVESGLEDHFVRALCPVFTVAPSPSPGKGDQPCLFHAWQNMMRQRFRIYLFGWGSENVRGLQRKNVRIVCPHKLQSKMKHMLLNKVSPQI